MNDRNSSAGYFQDYFRAIGRCAGAQTGYDYLATLMQWREEEGENDEGAGEEARRPAAGRAPGAH